MYLVDVYLESKQEAALTHKEIWAKLRPLCDAENIAIEHVLNCFCTVAIQTVNGSVRERSESLYSY